jgi:hypothetical protein
MTPHSERILGRLRERDIWQCDCRCDDQGGEPVMHETFLLWAYLTRDRQPNEAS